MDANVVDATAEALPLELLNATNRELTAQLSLAEEKLENVSRGVTDQRKRLQFMKEHLGNVRAEIVNTQSLAESKERELSSEDNMRRLIARECERLAQRQRGLGTDEEELRDRMTMLQNQLFQGNLKVEEFKAAMDFNQEALEQWDEARRQKEEDELALALYAKKDEGLIRQLQRQLEKHEGIVRDRRAKLEAAGVQAHLVQSELDRCADEYREVHRDRGGLLDEWEQVVKTIAERDEAIRVVSEQYAEGINWQMQRMAVKKGLSDELDEAHEETEVINYTIKERERVAQDYRDALPGITAQVQELEDEVAALREQAARSQRELSNRITQREALAAAIAAKQAALEEAARREAAALERRRAEMEAAADMQAQTALIEQLLKDAQRTERDLEHDVEQLKREQFAANQALQEVRTREADLMAEISGAQAQGKNMTAKVAQLDAQTFSQQEMLYNIEFSVQQMEKRVSRAKGERSEEERKALHDKIDLLQSTLDELEQQHRVLDLQVKRVMEELRQSNIEIAKLEATKGRIAEHLVEIELECSHGEREAKTLRRQREDALVQLDTMELQLTRLHRALRNKSNELFTLEERKRQLQVDVAEREAQIAAHHQLLRAEAKLAEESRRKLTAELLERQRALQAVRRRHEVLVGALDPGQARLSQAQLVVAAAKEREDLQYRGDSLDARIKRMEREMRKLEKTVSVIKASNGAYRRKFDKVSDEDEAVQTQRMLKERFRELKSMMTHRALESNDFQTTLDAKQGELGTLAMEREQAAHTLQALQEELQRIEQDAHHAKETTARYEQAIEKARRAVDETIVRDVSLLETKERLDQVVRQLLRCARSAGEEVETEVRRMLIESNVPMGVL